MYTILDCYTDEPAGLGVPPYIGTYPRYIAGALKEKVNYITIDDLRTPHKPSLKTDITTYNKTNHNIQDIIKNTKELIVIAGIHTPGKYLSAVPGTLKEITELIKQFRCRKILTGPAGSIHGSRLEGGKLAEKVNLDIFDEIEENYLDTNNYSKIKDFAVKGAEIIKQHPSFPNTIAEIETARGCPRKKGCSFCTEPTKGLIKRDQKDIIKEIQALSKEGIKHFRLGKQSDFFAPTAKEIESLLKEISKLKPKTLHIDNINPASVTEEKTKIIVKYCTEGNVAAFGVESFDKDVIKANNLNSDPETTLKAIRILNKFGAEKGKNGMPKLLPGINILFGLKDESKQTHEANMHYLKKILEENLLIRRINIRQVVAYPNTPLYEQCKNKFIKKNKKYYWKWRNQIRQEIDLPMLKKLAPKDTILKDLITEIHDGNTTFCRQLGTYPLIVGIKERLELKKKIDVKITGHMLRSLIGGKI